MHPDVKEILFDEDQIAARVAELGRQISEDYAGQEVLVVCVLNGAMPFTADLLRKLDGQVCLDTIAASSYGSGTISSGTVKITKELKTDIVGRNVLLSTAWNWNSRISADCGTGKRMLPAEPFRLFFLLKFKIM